MIIAFYEFPNEQAAKEMFSPYDESNMVVDYVGGLYRLKYGVSPNEATMQDVEQIGGYHVNIMADSLPPEAEQFRVFPKTPSRTFWIEAAND